MYTMSPPIAWDNKGRNDISFCHLAKRDILRVLDQCKLLGGPQTLQAVLAPWPLMGLGPVPHEGDRLCPTEGSGVELGCWKLWPATALTATSWGRQIACHCL